MRQERATPTMGKRIINMAVKTEVYHAEILQAC